MPAGNIALLHHGASTGAIGNVITTTKSLVPINYLSRNDGGITSLVGGKVRLNEGGKYLITFTIHAAETAGANQGRRSIINGYLNLDSYDGYDHARSTGYIRRLQGSESSKTSTSYILDANANDVISLWVDYKDEINGALPTTKLVQLDTGFQIIKLDDWDMIALERNVQYDNYPVQSAPDTWRNYGGWNIQKTIDAGFDHTPGDDLFRVPTTGWYLISYNSSYYTLDTGKGRINLKTRLLFDSVPGSSGGNIAPTTETPVYISNNQGLIAGQSFDNMDIGSASNIQLVYLQSGTRVQLQDLLVDGYDKYGTVRNNNCDSLGRNIYSFIQAIALPSSIKKIVTNDTSTNQRIDGIYDTAWNNVTTIESPFSLSTPNISVSNTDDYLFLYQYDGPIATNTQNNQIISDNMKLYKGATPLPLSQESGFSRGFQGGSINNGYTYYSGGSAAAVYGALGGDNFLLKHTADNPYVDPVRTYTNVNIQGIQIGSLFTTQVPVLVNYDTQIEIQSQVDLSTDYDTQIDIKRDLSTDYDTQIEIQSQVDLSTDYDTEIEIQSQVDLSTDYDTEIEIQVQIQSTVDYDTRIEIQSQVDQSTEYDTQIDIKRDLSTEYDTQIDIKRRLTVDYDTEINIKRDLSTNYDTQIDIKRDLSTEYDTQIDIKRSLSTEYDTQINIKRDLYTEYDTQIEIQIQSTVDYDTQIDVKRQLTTDYDTEIEIERGLSTEYDTQIEIQIQSTVDYDTQIDVKRQLTTDYDTQIKISYRFDYDTEINIKRLLSTDYDTEIDVKRQLTTDYDTEIDIKRDLSTNYDTQIDIKRDLSTDYDTEIDVKRQLTTDYDTNITIEVDYALVTFYDTQLIVYKEIPKSTEYDTEIDIKRDLSVEYDTEITIDPQIPKSVEYDTEIIIDPQIPKSVEYDTQITIKSEIDQSVEYDTEIIITSSTGTFTYYDTEIIIDPQIPKSVDYDTQITIKSEIPKSVDYDTEIQISTPQSIEYDTEIEIIREISQSVDYDTEIIIEKTIDQSTDYDTEIVIENLSTVYYDTEIIIGKTVDIELDYDTVIVIDDGKRGETYDTLITIEAPNRGKTGIIGDTYKQIAVKDTLSLLIEIGKSPANYEEESVYIVPELEKVRKVNPVKAIDINTELGIEPVEIGIVISQVSGTISGISDAEGLSYGDTILYVDNEPLPFPGKSGEILEIFVNDGDQISQGEEVLKFRILEEPDDLQNIQIFINEVKDKISVLNEIDFYQLENNYYFVEFRKIFYDALVDAPNSTHEERQMYKQEFNYQFYEDFKIINYLQTVGELLESFSNGYVVSDYYAEDLIDSIINEDRSLASLINIKMAPTYSTDTQTFVNINGVTKYLNGLYPRKIEQLSSDIQNMSKDNLTSSTDAINLKAKIYDDIEFTFNRVADKIRKVGILLGYDLSSNYYRSIFLDLQTKSVDNYNIITDTYLKAKNVQNDINDFATEFKQNLNAKPVSELSTYKGEDVLKYPSPQPEPEPPVEYDGPESGGDINYRDNPSGETPTAADKIYWEKFMGFASLIGLAPIYWQTGFIAPSPTGPVAIPFPILYQPISVISLPIGLFVIGTSICGIMVAPFIWAVNPTDKPLGSVPPGKAQFIFSINGVSKTTKPENKTAPQPLLKQGPYEINVDPEFTKTMPFIKDDLPPWERLSIDNLLLVSHLQEWCEQGKQTQGIPGPPNLRS